MTEESSCQPLLTTTDADRKGRGRGEREERGGRRDRETKKEDREKTQSTERHTERKTHRQTDRGRHKERRGLLDVISSFNRNLQTVRCEFHLH